MNTGSITRPKQQDLSLVIVKCKKIGVTQVAERHRERRRRRLKNKTVRFSTLRNQQFQHRHIN